MNTTTQYTCCPKCGRPDLRTLTWRELGIQETTLGCWDCDWVTFPAGVTAENWQERMRFHKEFPRFIEGRIDEIMKGTNLAPETVRLLELAKEAHATGKMPEIPKIQPTHFHDCTGTTSGVGKITAPHPLR